MRKVSPSQGNDGIIAQIRGKVKRVLVVGMVFAVVGAGVMPVFRAGAISEEQMGKISMNCASIKVQLRALQKVDSRMRVYLGSKYEIMLSNFITNLNLRLVKNNLATKSLTELQTTFSSERERFKSDFTSYSQALEALIGVDCKSNPMQFHVQLELVREWRADVQASYFRLNEVLGWHRDAVVVLRGAL